jgi:hypothetical protein
MKSITKLTTALLTVLDALLLTMLPMFMAGPAKANPETGASLVEQMGGGTTARSNAPALNPNSPGYRVDTKRS